VRRGERGRLRTGILLSAAVHVGLLIPLWVAASRQEKLPEMRVYAVNIVSPPPQQLGEPRPAEPAVPEPEPEAEPTPAPPAPPPPPPPAPAPQRTTAPRPSPPPPQAPPRQQPQQQPPPREAQASTGPRPDPTSAGGENINLQLRGVECPTPDYCENIILQVNRYFRNPSGGVEGEAEVYFVINRDGSVSGLRMVSSTGRGAFRLAVMEAVEQAGLNRSFGPLPALFQADQLPVSFYFRPRR